MSATGKLGPGLFFAKTPDGHKACKLTVPTNPNSELQVLQRQIMGYAVTSWQNLSPDQKETFDLLAKNLGLQMSGYNYYISGYFDDFGEAPPPPPPGILEDAVAYWKFNEGLGVDVEDEIGTNDITLSGNVIWKTDGIFGSNAVYTPNQTLGKIEGNGVALTPPCSISMWVKVMDKAAGQNFLLLALNRYRHSPIALDILIYCTPESDASNTNYKIRLYDLHSGGVAEPGFSLLHGQWNHVVWVQTDATHAKIYANDVLIFDDVYAWDPDNVGTKLYLGTTQDTNWAAAGAYIQNEVDCAIFYSKALSTENVHTLYTEEP